MAATPSASRHRVDYSAIPTPDCLGAAPEWVSDWKKSPIIKDDLEHLVESRL